MTALLPDPETPIEAVRAWTSRQAVEPRVLAAYSPSFDLDIGVPPQERWKAIGRFRAMGNEWNELADASSTVRSRLGPVRIPPGTILSQYLGRWCSYVWCLWIVEMLDDELRSGVIKELVVMTEDDHLWRLVTDWAAVTAPDLTLARAGSHRAPAPRAGLKSMRSRRPWLPLLTAIGKLGLSPIVRSQRPRVMVVDHRNTRPVAKALRRRDLCAYNTLLLASKALQKLPWRSRTTAFGTPSDLGALRGGTAESRANRAVVDCFLSDGPQIRARSHALINALDHVRPDIVVAHNWEGPISGPIRAWAKARGRLFAVVQHGLPMGTRWSATTSKIDADVFYCWGSRTLDAVDRTRNPDVELAALGNPLYLPTANHGARTHRIPRVLVAPSAFLPAFDDKWYDFWYLVERLMADPELESVEWVVRLHNLSRQRTWISELIRSAGGRVVGTETAFHTDAQNSDVVMTTASSVVLDTIQSGVPVVVWNSIYEPNDFDAAALVTADPVTLRHELRRLLLDAEHRASQLASQRTYAAGYVAEGATHAIARDLERRLKVCRLSNRRDRSP